MSAARMTHANDRPDPKNLTERQNKMYTEITLAIGHGVTGVLPHIGGSIHTLSIWQNNFEGHLPEMHLHSHGGLLLAYGNHLSC
eukprot:5283138-Amphidinium_carterae.1